MNREIAFSALLFSIVLLRPALGAAAEPAKPKPPAKALESPKEKPPAAAVADPVEPPPSFRTGLLTEQNIDRSRKDFKQCLEAAAEVKLAESAYAAGKGNLADVLQAERKLTAAQIHYLSTTSNVRGNPSMREYLTRRGEVGALERGLADVTAFAGKASTADVPVVREEVARYKDAIKEARRELLRAEYAWKSASRADQLRYLDRNEDPR